MNIEKILNMQNEYRVMPDEYAGYEAQVKHWWFPFAWFMVFGCHTKGTVQECEERIKRHALGGRKVDPYNE